MKNYMLFFGSNYYPYGGMDDFKGHFDSLEEAVEFLNNYEGGYGSKDWFHVYSIKDQRIVRNEGCSL